MGFLESVVSLFGEGTSEHLKFAGTPRPSATQALEKLPTLNHMTDDCWPPGSFIKVYE